MTSEPETAEEYNAAAEQVSGASGGPQMRIAKWTVQRLYRVWGDNPMTPETFGFQPADAWNTFDKGSFFFWYPTRKDDADAAAKNLGASQKRTHADEVLILEAKISNLLNGSNDKDINTSVGVGAWPGVNGKAPKKMWYNAGYQLITLPSMVQAFAVASGMMEAAYDYANVIGVPPTEDAQLQFIGTDEAPGELIVARKAIWTALGKKLPGDEVDYHKYTAIVTLDAAGKIVPDLKRKTNVIPGSNLWNILRVMVQGYKPFEMFAKVVPWVDPPTPDVIDSKGQARSVPLVLEAYKTEAEAIKACGDDYVKPEGGKKMPAAFVAAGASASDFQEFLNGVMKAMPAGANAKEWIRSGPGLMVMRANDLANDLDAIAEWL